MRRTLLLSAIAGAIAIIMLVGTANACPSGGGFGHGAGIGPSFGAHYRAPSYGYWGGYSPWGGVRGYHHRGAYHYGGRIHRGYYGAGYHGRFHTGHRYFPGHHY